MASGRPPPLSQSSVVNLLREHYDFKHIEESSVKQLPSYSDLNFYFRGTPAANASEVEYMFKILNRVRISREMADGLSALWAHLQSRGLDYTGPLPNKQGEMVTTLNLSSEDLLRFEGSGEKPLEVIESQSFSARVMRFVPGEVFDALEKHYLTPNIMFEVGAFIGKIDNALKDGFHNSAIENRINTDWDLMYFPNLRKQLHLLDDPMKREMVEKSLQGFEEYVLPRVSNFKKGIIYNDASGQNIILQRESSKDEYRVVGMIDFDETVHSCYVFDLAISLAYILMENLSPAGYPSPIQFIAPLISGYTSVFPLTTDEQGCLYFLTLARCCQSAVSGEVKFKAEPWNEYLLTTPEKSWRVIDLLLHTGKDYVDKCWGVE